MSKEKLMQEMTVDELNQELKELYKEAFSLRIQKATAQLTRTHQLRVVKKSIARAKTILTQKSGGTK